MYSVNETIEAKFLLLHPTTGLPVTGATVVSTLYDETDTIHSYPTVTEIGNGLYTASFVPDTAGEWTIIFGCSTPVQSGGLTFPVGLGICKDVEDKVDIVDANVDSVLADTNELQTDWTNGGRLDLLLDGVKTKTDLIGASVAPSNEYDTEMARITGNVALEATLTAIKGGDWSNETLKAIYDSIGGLNDITAASVWAVGTRALTDKANFTLSTSGIDAIRTSVCLTGDTANSIGKILYDYYNTRLSSTRCGYIDYLASGTYGLSALKTLIDTVDSVADAIKLKTDLLFAVSSSSVSHDITTANDTVETVIEEIEDTNNYSLSLFFDLDSLESASEGEIVTIKLYNKIDGSNYSDSPIAVSEYVVGSEIEYPSIETNVLSGYSKITISCSGEVTATRSIVCRILKRNL